MLIKIVGAIVAAVVVAAVVVGVGMWRGLIPAPGPLAFLMMAGEEPEYSARFYPEDTLAYSWFTLMPGGGQLSEMRAIWNRFNEYPAFEDLIAEVKDDFDAETGIDFDADVMPWIGPEIAGGLISIDFTESEAAPDEGMEPWEEVRAAFTIGVRDREAAAAFMDKWIIYLQDSEGTTFTAGADRGFSTWVDEADRQAYGLSDEWLVFATSASTLQEMIGRIASASDGAGSLAANPNFTAARAALPERRFSSGYVDLQRASESLEGDFLPGGGFGTFGMAAFADQNAEWGAVAGTWVERGVTMEMVTPAIAAAGGAGLDGRVLSDPSRLLPDDTLGFAAAAYDPDVDNWRTALREYRLADVLPYPGMIDEINAGLAGMTPGEAELADDATLADVLDLGFELAKDFTGIDLEGGFFDHLAGELLLAVREFNFDAVEDDPANNPVQAMLLLSYREDGAAGLQATMDDITELVDGYLAPFVESGTADVGGASDATVFRVDGAGYSPGYVLHDGYLTMGSTTGALAAIVERQNGGGAALTAEAEYQRAVGYLAEERQFLGYVNINRIIGQLDPDDLDMDRDEYRILAEGLGVAAMDARSDGAYDRATAVLTLFPE